MSMLVYGPAETTFFHEHICNLCSIGNCRNRSFVSAVAEWSLHSVVIGSVLLD
jgi:hypothetical protein